MANKIFLAVIAVCLICLLYACGDQGSGTSGKTITGLSLSPSTANLTVGSTESYVATATYSNGSTGPIVPVWTTTGTQGTITTVGFVGLFTAAAAGSGEVIATSGGFSAEATFIIVAAPTREPGGLTTIEVAPSSADLRISASQIFTASGRNNSGEATGITPTWSISGDTVGAFTSSGTIATLEATAEGTAFIRCVSGEVSTTVPVTVEGAIVSITVEADTYIDEANPGITMEGQTIVKGGYNDVTGKSFYAFLRFPLSSLPAGVTIEAATLRVFVDSTDTATFQLANLNGPFDSSTTWSSKPSFPGSSILSATFTAGQYNSISGDQLLTQVRAWYADQVNNFGLGIYQGTVTNGVVNIQSLENGANHPAMLDLTYK